MFHPPTCDFAPTDKRAGLGPQRQSRRLVIQQG